MTAISVDLQSIFKKFPNGHRDSLISIMQEVQEANGFLSKEAVVSIGLFLNLPASKIYGVATFYNQFRFQPLGEHHIQICRGTACHVKGSASLLEVLKQELSIDDGETTKDGLFSIEVVACIGACGLAPVIAVNGQFYAKLTNDILRKLIRKLRKSNPINRKLKS